MTWTWDWKVLWRKVLPNKELSEEKLFLTSRRIDWCNKTIVRFQNLLNLDYEFTVQIKKSILHCLMSWNLDYEFMDVFKKTLQDLKILWGKVCRIEELSEDKLFLTSWRIDWCNKTWVRFQNLWLLRDISFVFSYVVRKISFVISRISFTRQFYHVSWVEIWQWVCGSAFNMTNKDSKILWRKVLPIKELSEEKLFPASWRIDWCNKMKVRFQNLLDLDYEFTDQINLSILHCLKILNLDYEFMDLLQNDDQRLENFVKKSSSYQRIVWRKVVPHIETHRLM